MDRPTRSSLASADDRPAARVSAAAARGSAAATGRLLRQGHRGVVGVRLLLSRGHR